MHHLEAILPKNGGSFANRRTDFRNGAIFWVLLQPETTIQYPMPFSKELNKRRTFAIISHPDAGKTTLTEKFLLFGGAIQTAGAVKSNKIKKTATSDFMEIEKQRGISVATSVMNFEYRGLNINLLDTPGHKDFAEDTYRTLTAVDSVVLVIDSVNGVEAQTRRLMEVIAMRKTPVIVFINKMDRDGKNRFDLLEEIEKELKIQLHPMTFPINSGKDFKGVYDIHKKSNDKKLISAVDVVDKISKKTKIVLIYGRADEIYLSHS